MFMTNMLTITKVAGMVAYTNSEGLTSNELVAIQNTHWNINQNLLNINSP